MIHFFCFFCKKITFRIYLIKRFLSITRNIMTEQTKETKFILWFNEIWIEDVPLVGGKNASLGEMYTNLTP